MLCIPSQEVPLGDSLDGAGYPTLNFNITPPFNVTSSLSGLPPSLPLDFYGYMNNSPGGVVGTVLNYSSIGGATHAQTSSSLDDARNFLRTVIVPVICVFGMLGNILTLLVLTRKRLKITCDGTERTVHIGLTALAVSDLLFCVCLLPHGLFRTERFAYDTPSFQLLYRSYSHALINSFILTSTWLTVTMATSRYLAICHPFRARHVIGITGTKASILLVFLGSLAFNIPRAFQFHIEIIPCIDGGHIYLKNNGYMRQNDHAHTIYVWMYFTIGIFAPLAALAFCNIALVKALHESVKIRKRYRVPAAHVDSNYRITSILVTIVVMYILLVSPAEILLFVKDRAFSNTDAAPFIMAVELTNVLQTINFSCNFVLCFVLNVHFRRAMRDLLCACCKRCTRQGTHKHRLGVNRQMSLRTTQTNV